MKMDAILNYTGRYFSKNMSKKGNAQHIVTYYIKKREYLKNDILIIFNFLPRFFIKIKALSLEKTRKLLQPISALRELVGV
jgi:hypothetical protein